MPTKAKHPKIKDLRQGKVVFQVHDTNRDGQFEVRLINIFSIAQRYQIESFGKKSTRYGHRVKCNMPLYDLEGALIAKSVYNPLVHQLANNNTRHLRDSTFGSFIYTTRRAAERAAKNLNDYVSRQGKLVHTIGVYPNGEFLQGIRTNVVGREHLVNHVHYNLDWRPGRALIVNNKVIYPGNVDREKLLRIIQHYKDNPPELLYDSAPYQ